VPGGEKTSLATSRPPPLRSYGSLAVLTRATFKLSPLPPASRTVVATVAGAREAASWCRRSPATATLPSAIELDARPFDFAC